MAISDMAFKLPNLAESAAALRWARRLLLLQGRLRSNEPTQILACASFGAVIGALVAGLHLLVDWLHHVAFNIAGDHTLSTGIGIDAERILVVPALGGLLLGIGALIMRRYRPNDVIDPIEANALHGGRMSMKDSLRLTVATVWSNGADVSVGMEAGYSQIGAAVLSGLLPRPLAGALDSVQSYGFIILLGLLYLGIPSMLYTPVISFVLSLLLPV